MFNEGVIIWVGNHARLSWMVSAVIMRDVVR